MTWKVYALLPELITGEGMEQGGFHHLDVLQHQLEALDPDSTVLEEMERVAAPGERPALRKLLGCFLFRGRFFGLLRLFSKRGEAHTEHGGGYRQ